MSARYPVPPQGKRAVGYSQADEALRRSCRARGDPGPAVLRRAGPLCGARGGRRTVRVGRPPRAPGRGALVRDALPGRPGRSGGPGEPREFRYRTAQLRPVPGCPGLEPGGPVPAEPPGSERQHVRGGADRLPDPPPPGGPVLLPLRLPSADAGVAPRRVTRERRPARTARRLSSTGTSYFEQTATALIASGLPPRFAASTSHALGFGPVGVGLFSTMTMASPGVVPGWNAGDSAPPPIAWSPGAQVAVTRTMSPEGTVVVDLTTEVLFRYRFSALALVMKATAPLTVGVSTAPATMIVATRAGTERHPRRPFVPNRFMTSPPSLTGPVMAHTPRGR